MKKSLWFKLHIRICLKDQRICEHMHSFFFTLCTKTVYNERCFEAPEVHWESANIQIQRCV